MYNDNAEQWKLQGNCSECRRQKYCNKECKIHKIKVKNKMYNLIAEQFDERTNGLYSEIMSHLYRR